MMRPTKVIYEKIDPLLGTCVCGNSPCVVIPVKIFTARLTAQGDEKTWTSDTTFIDGLLKWKGTKKKQPPICQQCFDVKLGEAGVGSLDVWHETPAEKDARINDTE